MVHKREKLKRNLLACKAGELELRLEPFKVLMLRILDRLVKEDKEKIFHLPVDLTDAPDYLDIIRSPMDLFTMRQKVLEYKYPKLEDFEFDFKLMITNCFDYNYRDTIYYAKGLQLLYAGEKIFEDARQIAETHFSGKELDANTVLPF